MFKLIVDGKNGHEEGLFSTEEAAQAHFDSNRVKGYWGSEAQTIEHGEIPGVQAVEATEAVLDVAGNIIIPATEAIESVDAIPAWTEHIPAQFTWEIVPFNTPLENISPRQIRLALLSIGITSAMVEAAIANLPSPQKDQATIAWNYSNYFSRTEPAVAMIGTLAGLNSEQLDNLWILGATL